MTIPFNTVAGPRTVPDNQQSAIRAGRGGELIIGEVGQGRYYEAAARGMIFTVSTPLAGVTVTANNVVSVASSNAICGLANPTGNSKNLSILRAVLIVVTGTMATGGFVWGAVGTPSGLSATAVGVTTYIQAGTNTTGGASGYAFDSTTAWSGTAATKILRQFGGAVAGATAAGVNLTFEEITDGDIVLKPGSCVGLFMSTVATALIVGASITWCETAI